MDEMKIKLSTNFMRGLVSKLISKMIYKKLGYKIDIQLNDLDVSTNNGNVFVKLNAEANLKSDELTRIVKGINLD